MIFSIGISAIVGIIRFQKLPNYSKLLTTILSISFISEIIKILIVSQLDRNNPEEISRFLYYSHIKTIIFSTVELVIFLFIYRILLQGLLKDSFFIIAFTIYSIIALICFLTLEDLAEIFSYLNTFEAVTIIISSIALFYKQFVDLEKDLLKKPVFWINSAVLFYFAAIFFFFIFKHYVSIGYAQLLFSIVYISQSIYCLTITFALCLPQQTIQK